MNNAVLIKNARVITPTGVISSGWVFCEGRQIRLVGVGDVPDFGGAEVIDAGGLTLLPGFIDVHAHGALGFDTMDASPDGLRKMARFYAQHGVTAFLPTTWTETRERTSASLEVVAELLGPQPDGATILGVHLEGPYLNPSKCGAQKLESIRRAGRDEATAFLDYDVIRLLAIAPEYEENRWLIQECVRRGITVSVAHTAATYAHMVEAVRLGLTHATHTFNAMTALSHREPGVVGAVLSMPEVRCELIADTIHVHPAVMRILYAAKGRDGVVLITDAVRCAGLSEGEYAIDERKVIVQDGAVRLPDGTLAGSILTMEVALRNFIQATGQPIEEVWQASSLNAARAIHVADRKGSIEVGKDADLVLTDDNICVRLTMAEGRVVYRDEGVMACT